MTKQEQIEDMTKIMRVAPFFLHSGSSEDFLLKRDSAKELYNAGYRKIDDDCAVITKAELKQYKVQAVKEFAERLKTEPRITDLGLEFVALVDIDAELEALLNEYEK